MATTTLNISLPTELAKKVDEYVASNGYVSRSELFRKIVKYLENIKTIIEPKTDPVEVVIYKNKPYNEVRKAFKDTGLYNQKFINSLIAGLKDADKNKGNIIKL